MMKVDLFTRVCIGVVVVAGGWVVLVGAPRTPATADQPEPAHYSCKFSEQEIRQMMVSVRATGEAERIAQTHEALQAACDLAGRAQHQRPPPLPASLQDLAK